MPPCADCESILELSFAKVLEGERTLKSRGAGPHKAAPAVVRIELAKTLRSVTGERRGAKGIGSHRPEFHLDRSSALGLPTSKRRRPRQREMLRSRGGAATCGGGARPPLDVPLVGPGAVPIAGRIRTRGQDGQLLR